MIVTTVQSFRRRRVIWLVILPVSMLGLLAPWAVEVLDTHSEKLEASLAIALLWGAVKVVLLLCVTLAITNVLPGVARDLRLTFRLAVTWSVSAIVVTGLLALFRNPIAGLLDNGDASHIVPYPLRPGAWPDVYVNTARPDWHLGRAFTIDLVLGVGIAWLAATIGYAFGHRRVLAIIVCCLASATAIVTVGFTCQSFVSDFDVFYYGIWSGCTTSSLIYPWFGSGVETPIAAAVLTSVVWSSFIASRFMREGLDRR